MEEDLQVSGETPEENKMEEITETEKQETEKMVSEEKVGHFLKSVGLDHPLDFVFLSYATTKSVKAIDAMDPKNLLFLFHLLTSEMVEKNQLFPRAAFAEKVIKDDKKVNIIWTFSPSETYESRLPKSFENFHLYFMNILKPSYQYSAEELYKIFRDKKEEMYFLNHGSRDDSENKLFHVLFVCPKMIIAFHIPFLDIEEIPSKELFMSKWVSNTSPVLLQEVFEHDVFEFPGEEYFSPNEKTEVS